MILHIDAKFRFKFGVWAGGYFFFCDDFAPGGPKPKGLPLPDLLAALYRQTRRRLCALQHIKRLKEP
jgi:hypothetical protein